MTINATQIKNTKTASLNPFNLAVVLLLFFLINNTSAAEFTVPPPPPLSEQNKKSQTRNSASAYQLRRSEQAEQAKKTKQSKPEDQKARKKSDKPDETQEQFPAPEVVIRYQDDTKIAEYRVAGQLRYAKITPSSGPAYYLIDSNGDGTLDSRHAQLDNPPITQWLLFEW